MEEKYKSVMYVRYEVKMLEKISLSRSKKLMNFTCKK